LRKNDGKNHVPGANPMNIPPDARARLKQLDSLQARQPKLEAGEAKVSTHGQEQPANPQSNASKSSIRSQLLFTPPSAN
jgi:hypothetical protein